MHNSFLYHPEKGFKSDISSSEIAASIKDDRALLWVDILDIEDADVDILTSIFNLHPITVEDFIMPNACSKIEKFKEYIFIVMFSLDAHLTEKEGRIKLVELNGCLGKNFLITFHDHPIDAVDIYKNNIKEQPALMAEGADMILYTLLDSSAASFFHEIKKFNNFSYEISDELFKDPSQDVLKRIYNLKNEIMYMRRIIAPEVDVISGIVRNEYPFVSQANAVYFRNIYDNLVRLEDLTSASRDVVTSTMEVYASLVSNRLSEVMKTLTIIATIMMPLTLLASIYGMNFKHMPALNSKFGYPAIIAAMVVVTITMLIYFKRKKWL